MTAFEAALEEEKGLRVGVETRIQALDGELKGAETRIRSTMADYKNNPTFDNHVELRSQQCISDFHQSVGYRNEIKLATIDDANRVLHKLKALHPEWNFIE